jgi:prepilin-type N-terminal cleavage/methylation domain-containing protein
MSSDRRRGFTLLEVVLAVAVAGMVMPVVVSSIFQVLRGTDRISSETVALSDIDNVSAWVSRDLSQAQQSDLPSCPTIQSTVRTDWVDETEWGAAVPQHFAEYYIESGTTLLKRNYDGTVGIVGRHVTAITFCQEASGLIQMDITVSVEGADPTTETLFYYISLRPEGSS